MNSILSFPDRGAYGDAKYRGNCSGHIIKAVLETYKPQLFVDPSEGSGTSRDVAREMGIEYHGFDLRNGFNLMADSLKERLPRLADLIFWHPAYWDIIQYSGNMWGKPHPDDLSRATSYEDFLEKCHRSLVNIYDALRKDGVYSVLVGDVRKKGRYYSIQADLQAMAPGHLDSIWIKTQHNCFSDKVKYSGNFVPIMHEYVINFKKAGVVFSILDATVANSERMVSFSNMSWRSVLEWKIRHAGGKITLERLYKSIAEEASEKIIGKEHWKAKVRQTLHNHFSNVDHGVWALPQAA